MGEVKSSEITVDTQLGGIINKLELIDLLSKVDLAYAKALWLQDRTLSRNSKEQVCCG